MSVSVEKGIALSNVKINFHAQFALHPETSLHAIGIVAPPMRHCNDLECRESHKEEKHVQVEAGIRSRAPDVSIALPPLVMVLLDVKVVDAGEDKPSQDIVGYITVEVLHGGTEDGDIP